MRLGGQARRTALVATVIVAFIGTPGTAAAGAPTKLTIYAPFTSSGAPSVRVARIIRGHCWTGSLASSRADAWRCMSGNFIYDPCFSSASTTGIVLCPNGPWSSAAIEIRLIQSLPRTYANRGKPSTAGVPWALVTTSGWKCLLATGATAVVDRRRANYGCGHTKDWLWGAPMRKPTPWRIYAAPFSATRLSRTARIRAAWF